MITAHEQHESHRARTEARAGDSERNGIVAALPLPSSSATRPLLGILRNRTVSSLPANNDGEEGIGEEGHKNPQHNTAEEEAGARSAVGA